ncbi:hypothetical protein DWG18_13000 [Lysobacter sp. TY2-98]|uniref:hypothetical protein n=1 Tax=Lysobacter sp. TY2-98 TaxID=2290922 RepID=UPI000E2049E3|nr:hypothetical protein [Lysobacter sp. TY2-98]AXK73104.1 hypothetical protein DWG18_13000 [Lysobacter sp. TY2-98]
MNAVIEALEGLALGPVSSERRLICSSDVEVADIAAARSELKAPATLPCMIMVPDISSGLCAGAALVA